MSTTKFRFFWISCRRLAHRLDGGMGGNGQLADRGAGVGSAFALNQKPLSGGGNGGGQAFKFIAPRLRGWRHFRRPCWKERGNAGRRCRAGAL
jgi:hypothetical protein